MNQFSDPHQFVRIDSIDDVDSVLSLAKEILGDNRTSYCSRHQGRRSKRRISIGSYSFPSDKFEIFSKVGVTCVCCGLKGTRINIYKELHSTHGRPIAILMGVRSDGSEEPITLDHIIPFSVGGKSSADNYRPMCEECNVLRNDSFVDPVTQHASGSRFERVTPVLPELNEIPDPFSEIEIDFS